VEAGTCRTGAERGAAEVEQRVLPRVERIEEEAAEEMTAASEWVVGEKTVGEMIAREAVAAVAEEAAGEEAVSEELYAAIVEELESKRVWNLLLRLYPVLCWMPCWKRCLWESSWWAVKI